MNWLLFRVGLWLWSCVCLLLTPTVKGQCDAALGMEDGSIKNNQLSASSKEHRLNGAKNARLNIFTFAWIPAGNDQTPHIQVDLGDRVSITKVATQGQGFFNDQNILEVLYAATFEVMSSFDGTDWNTISDNNNNQIFTGNADDTTINEQTFSRTVTLRFLRIFPKSCSPDGCALRFELYGCEAPPATTPTTTTGKNMTTMLSGKPSSSMISAGSVAAVIAGVFLVLALIVAILINLMKRQKRRPTHFINGNANQESSTANTTGSPVCDGKPALSNGKQMMDPKHATLDTIGLGAYEGVSAGEPNGLQFEGPYDLTIENNASGHESWTEIPAAYEYLADVGRDDSCKYYSHRIDGEAKQDNPKDEMESAVYEGLSQTSGEDRPNSAGTMGAAIYEGIADDRPLNNKKPSDGVYQDIQGNKALDGAYEDISERKTSEGAYQDINDTKPSEGEYQDIHDNDYSDINERYPTEEMGGDGMVHIYAHSKYGGRPQSGNVDSGQGNKTDKVIYQDIDDNSNGSNGNEEKQRQSKVYSEGWEDNALYTIE